MKTISIPFNNRPEVFSRVIDSLNAAIGIEHWTVCLSGESNAVVPKQIRCKHMVRSINAVRMGCWVNTFLAANLAMSIGSEFNLYLEDDIVISRDTLILSDQFQATSWPVLALRRPEATITHHPHKVEVFQGGLFGDGFAWRRDLWPYIRNAWFNPHGKLGYSMWDWSMEDSLKKMGIQQVRPCMNRSQNIGLVGTHQHGYDPNRHSPCYSGAVVNQFQFP